MPFELSSPVDWQELSSLENLREPVQFSTALTETDYRLVGEWMRERPEQSLRVYGAYDASIGDLDFLRWFPTLKRLYVDLYQLENFDGLEYLTEGLEVLALGATRRSLSLQGLSRFRELRRLSLTGHSKDIKVLALLTSLTDLTLGSITMPHLELLEPLEKLEALELALGGTTNLGLLPSIGHIRYLELWQVRGLDDISATAELPSLEYLFLQSLKRVEHLPDFSEAKALTRIHLEDMKGVTDLSILSKAPTLEHVALVNMPHLSPEALVPLSKLATLRSVRIGLGSDKKKRRAEEILGNLVSYDRSAWNLKPYRF